MIPRFALLCVIAVHIAVLQLPVSAAPISDTLTPNATSELFPASENETVSASSDQEEENTCPGCCKHPSEVCRILTRGVDHVQALGFQRNDITDWTSCSLSHFPQAK